MADVTEHRGLEPIRAWLTEAGLANLELRPLLEGLCTRLVAAGVPGGEILKFMGDGVLALFLTGEGGSGGGDDGGSRQARRGRAAIAAAALGAAEEILARAAKLDETKAAAGHPPLGLDIALHEGEVTYGIVGTEDRLDLTVIGPAVNEASRLEGLCKELGLALLVSESFAEASPEVRARLPVGRHRLRWGEGGEGGVYDERGTQSRCPVPLTSAMLARVG